MKFTMVPRSEKVFTGLHQGATTAQLAESFGTQAKIISQNFTRNQDRYAEDKHFIALQGEEKRAFLDRLQIEDGSKNAFVLYLWTEKGAWMHAKSLNTDPAIAR